jgi:hypothetical protein
VDTRLDHLHRESLGELREGTHRPARKARRNPRASCLDANDLPIRGCRPDLPNNSQVILSATNQALSVSGAKRSAPAQEKDGFQDRGLPGAVIAPDQAQARGDFQLGVADTADIGNGHGLKTHRAPTLARGWLQSAPDWMAGCS